MMEKDFLDNLLEENFKYILIIFCASDRILEILSFQSY